MENDKIVRHDGDLGFTIVAEATNSLVKYKIYNIITWNGGVPFWNRAGSPISPDPVDNLEDAQVFLHGEVKWDGCSNWHFDEQDTGMLHGCERYDLERIGEVMVLCWDWAFDLLPEGE